MSRTIKKFNADHQHALGELDQLEAALREIEASGSVDGRRAGVEDFTRFLEHALMVHFRQEEDALFPAMIKKAPHTRGLIQVMLDEHREITGAHGRMIAELTKAEPDAAVISKAGRTILYFLRPHIDKEETALQPMATEILSPEELEEVDRLADRYN